MEEEREKKMVRGRGSGAWKENKVAVQREMESTEENKQQGKSKTSSRSVRSVSHCRDIVRIEIISMMTASDGEVKAMTDKLQAGFVLTRGRMKVWPANAAPNVDRTSNTNGMEGEKEMLPENKYAIE